MSDSNFIDPVNNPEQAAHEVILELCRSGAFDQSKVSSSYGSSYGKLVAEAITTAHKSLAQYYKTLE